jgi:apolipoprotein D and lipocalin family protein
MLPNLDDLDRQVALAEAEVTRADEHVGLAVSTLKRRWSDRLPWVAGVGVAGLVAAAFLIAPRAGRHPSRVRPYSAWSRVTSPVVNLLVSRGIAAVVAFAAGLSSGRPKKAVETVPYVDLGRFAGHWFEVARLPISSERHCERDVTAYYEVAADGLRVLNRCTRAHGRVKAAIGRGRVADARTNAKLQISFAPSLLDVLPFVWADYWVVDLADDYSAAMVGTPDRRHLWLLSRTPSLPGAALATFIARAEQQGFDTTRLHFTEHTVRRAPPAPAATDEPAAASPPREQPVAVQLRATA